MVGVRLVPIENNRPADVVALELGQRGTDYVCAALRKGGQLAQSLAGTVGSLGLCFSPVEQGTGLEHALRFRSGMDTPTSAVRTWLANYIARHWGSDSQIVFEDPWLTKQDTSMNLPDQPYFFIGATPYYAPQADDVLARLMSGEKEVTSHSFAAFVVMPSVALPTSGQEATQSHKNFLLQNTRAVLLSAYDREGYVIWQKKK